MTHTLLLVAAHPDDESFGPGGTLAKYALAGRRVIYACATRGEVGSADPEHLQGHASPGDMRWAELMCASKALGLTEVIHLGYRDSGMPGSPDNTHPEALAAAPLEQVTARVVQLIRQHQPHVVVTFDPIGGYRHPDHIAIHNATVQAFHAAGDAAQYPEAGAAYAPQKLYFEVFGRGFLKLAVKVLPLFGQDPRHFGRNKDIDIASLAEVDFPTHARVAIPLAARLRKHAAGLCHRSQLAGGPPLSGLIGTLARYLPQTESFMRAHPPVPEGATLNELDLFQGI
jgi:N-acetyl-1-D-myo-inositol-2-amino-2-deoxy-alpha-D-glucopyranoside deacetylase/mycothiol S-conjugate amidase